MKKFFSILCAFAIVLSASAAPMQLSSKKGATLTKATAAKSLVAKKEAKKAPQANFRAFAKKEVLKPAALQAKAAKAPKAVKTTTDVAINSFGSQNYGGGNIYYELYSADGTMAFTFDIYLEDTEAEDVALGTTYTYADMGADYSICYDPNTYVDLFSYAEVEFTKTSANDLVRFEVKILDENGDTWNLLYQEEALPQACLPCHPTWPREGFPGHPLFPSQQSNIHSLGVPCPTLLRSSHS